MKDSIEIINENNLDAKYILEEIRQVEAEKGRKVIKAEFIDIGDNKCKQRFWFAKQPGFSRLRRITG